VKDKITLIRGDITQQEVEVLVNAANAHLAGGGGVDGAIHHAGGAAIMKELKEKYRGCPTGSAVITRAGNLRARYVIHAVGPRWQGGNKGEPTLLASAYRTSLALAQQYGCQTIAFPSISTGIYGYPVEEGAKIALKTVSQYLRENPVFTTVRFILFDEKTLKAYQGAYQYVGA